MAIAVISANASPAPSFNGLLRTVSSVLGAPYGVKRTGDLACNDASGIGATSVYALGCITPGDGAGGFFVWEATVLPDDGGVIIVPSTNPAGGHWRRVVDDFVNVRWFGAVGDGVTDDSAAIQAAVDYAPRSGPDSGMTVVIPAGKYRLRADAGRCAVAVTRHGVELRGVGSPPYGASKLLLEGPGSGIEFASLGRGSHMHHLSMYSGAPAARDYVLVHAPYVTVEHCYFATSKRWALLIESGAVGAGLTGDSNSPVGTYQNANGWRAHNNFYDQTGDSTKAGDESGGGGLYAHGSDSNGGYGTSQSFQNANIGHLDGTLGGGVWVNMYSEQSQIGAISRSSGPGTYVGCGTEDFIHARFDNAGSLIVGGTIQPIQGRGGILRSNGISGVYGLSGGMYSYFAAIGQAQVFTASGDFGAGQFYGYTFSANQYLMRHGNQGPNDAFALTASAHPDGSGHLRFILGHYEGATFYGTNELAQRSTKVRNGARVVGDSFPVLSEDGPAYGVFRRKAVAAAGAHGQPWTPNTPGWFGGASTVGIPPYQVEVTLADGTAHVFRNSVAGASGPSPPPWAIGATVQETLSAAQISAGLAPASWTYLAAVPTYVYYERLEPKP